LWDALQFVEAKEYVFLGCADPRKIGLRPVGRAPKAKDQKYELANEFGTCVTVRAAVTYSSHARVPRERPADAKYHSLQIAAVDFTHGGHRERAATCMILGTDEVQAPVYESAVTYSTLTTPISSSKPFTILARLTTCG
jgi:hypothetical protein